MAIPAALMKIGTGVQIVGQLMGNMAQASAQLKNARYLEKQAQFAREAARRAVRISEQEYATKYGNQAGAYAASGVDVGSGSAALLLGQTYAAAIEEVAAIKKRGEMEFELAMGRAELNRKEGNMLRSPLLNLAQAGTTFLNNYTASEAFGQGFSTSLAPDGPPPSGTGARLTYFPNRNQYGGYAE